MVLEDVMPNNPILVILKVLVPVFHTPMFLAFTSIAFQVCGVCGFA